MLITFFASLLDGEFDKYIRPAFLPAYYRRHAMAMAPAERNVLAHYAEEGERLGYRRHRSCKAGYKSKANNFLSVVRRTSFEPIKSCRPTSFFRVSIDAKSA